MSVSVEQGIAQLSKALAAVAPNEQPDTIDFGRPREVLSQLFPQDQVEKYLSTVDEDRVRMKFALSLAKQTATLLAVWEEEDDLALEFSSITGLMKTSFTNPASLSKVAVHFLKANNWDVSKNMDKFQTTLNLAYSVYVLQKQMEWRMKVGKKGNNKGSNKGNSKGGVSLEDFVIGTAEDSGETKEDRMESQTKGVERKVSNKEGKGSQKNRDAVKKDSVKATPEKKVGVSEKSEKSEKVKKLAALALAKKLKKAKGGSAKKVKK